MKTLLSAISLALIFSSCAGNEPEYDSALGPIINTSADSTGAVAPMLSPIQSPMASPAGAMMPANATMPANAANVVPVTTQQNVQTARAGMNPAHGQPGHRCDIAVGAPLSSAPTATIAQPSQNVTTTTQTPTVVQTPAPVAPTAPGMNPPHGQPGHRCDIEVGKPLNSKPAAAAQTVNPGSLNQIGTAPASASFAPIPDMKVAEQPKTESPK